MGFYRFIYERRRAAVFAILVFCSWNVAKAQHDSSKIPAHTGITIGEAYVRFVDRVKLSFQRSGILSELSFREGDEVDAGISVSRLENAVARATLAIAEAEASSDVDFRAAKKESEAARAEFEAVLRANRMTPNTFPEPDVLRLGLASQRAELLIEQKEHEHRIAKLTKEQADAELATYGILAPFAGTVTNVFKSVGESVQPGEDVVEIVNTQRVRVDGYVDLADAWRVRPGDRVQVRVVDAERKSPVASKQYHGTLRFVDVSVQTVRRVVRVWSEVDNADGRLRDGLTAEMTVFPSVEGTLRKEKLDAKSSPPGRD